MRATRPPSSASNRKPCASSCRKASPIPRPDRTTLVLGCAGLAGFAFCGALGAVVSQRTPSRIDIEGFALRGTWVPAAVLMTRLGYWPVLSTLSALAVVHSRANPRGRGAVPALVLSHTVSQWALAGAKLLFRRKRPDAWLIRREIDTSYPSGHSATAVTFYLAMALVEARASTSRAGRVAAGLAGAACLAGIPLSRLALGAHYVTDVAGGLTFGGAWLALSCALVRGFPRSAS